MAIWDQNTRKDKISLSANRLSANRKPNIEGLFPNLSLLVHSLAHLNRLADKVFPFSFYFIKASGMLIPKRSHLLV